MKPATPPINLRDKPTPEASGTCCFPCGPALKSMSRASQQLHKAKFRTLGVPGGIPLPTHHNQQENIPTKHHIIDQEEHGTST